MSTPPTEAQILANEPEIVEIAGRKLTLRPMTLRVALRVKELAEPFVAEMATGQLNVTRVMMRHATRLADMAGLMLGDPAFVDGLLDGDGQQGEDAFDDLLGRLLGVNQAFFVRWALAVSHADMAERAQALLKSLGDQSPTSPTSPETTAGPTQ